MVRGTPASPGGDRKAGGSSPARRAASPTRRAALANDVVDDSFGAARRTDALPPMDSSCQRGVTATVAPVSVPGPPHRRLLARTDHDREILRLAFPALGALLAEPLYLVADTAVVGHLGTPQLGGVAVATAVLTSVFWMFNFLATGTGALVARLHGAGDDEGATAHAAQALWLALGIGGALVVAGLVLAPLAVDLFGADDEVRSFAVRYLRISILGAPAFLTILAGMGYRRGFQDTLTPLGVLVASNAANLAIELVLIFGLGYGVGASALATVVAQYGAAATFVVLLVRGSARAGASLRPDRRRLRRSVVVGGHLTVRTGALVLAFAIATAVASRLGTVPLAAHQIAYQVWLFLAFALDSIAIAGEAMTGRFLGAGQVPAARAAARRMLEWGVLLGVATGLLVAAIRVPLADVFTDDAAVRALAAHALWFVALMQPVNAVVFVLDGVLIGAADTRYLATAMLASLAVFVPSALAVLAAGATLGWLWAAFTLFLLARAVTMGARYVTGSWAVTGADR